MHRDKSTAAGAQSASKAFFQRGRKWENSGEWGGEAERG